MNYINNHERMHTMTARDDYDSLERKNSSSSSYRSNSIKLESIENLSAIEQQAPCIIYKNHLPLDSDSVQDEVHYTDHLNSLEHYNEYKAK